MKPLAYQIVPEELHYQCGILVALLAESVQLGNGLVEGLLGQATSLLRSVQDFIVEHGEVESEPQPDRVGRREVGVGDLAGLLIGVEGLLRRELTFLSCSKLGQVPVVIPLPIGVVSYAV